MYGRAEGVWQVGAYGWFLAEALEKTLVLSEKAFSRLLNLVPLRLNQSESMSDRERYSTLQRHSYILSLMDKLFYNLLEISCHFLTNYDTRCMIAMVNYATNASVDCPIKTKRSRVR